MTFGQHHGVSEPHRKQKGSPGCMFQVRTSHGGLFFCSEAELADRGSKTCGTWATTVIAVNSCAMTAQMGTVLQAVLPPPTQRGCGRCAAPPGVGWSPLVGGQHPADPSEPWVPPPSVTNKAPQHLADVRRHLVPWTLVYFCISILTKNGADTAALSPWRKAAVFARMLT